MTPGKCAAFSECFVLFFVFLLIASIGQAKVQILEFDHTFWSKAVIMHQFD